VLARHAQALGARIRRGTELVGITQAPDGIEALLRDADGGHGVVSARYLIGADGAHGPTRLLLGIRRRGPGVVGEAITALFHAPLWQIAGARRYLIYWIGHPEAAGVLVPAGHGDRWIYGLTREPGIVDACAYGQAELARLIRLAAGVPDLGLRIGRTGSFAYTAQIADRFREGDAFLAGDAAHQITPRGGTGMNTAIRDGYDLGWKLAWTLRGWAGAELLDSYESERRPVAVHNVARSADANGSTRDVTDELHVDLGGRIPHIWVDSGPSRRSTLDLLGPGLTRFTGPGGGMPGERAPAPFAAAPVAEHRLSAVTARALGIGARGSLLVRPDGAPARVTAQAELGALSA
jgi:2-polyprenyl-6-methoxyphenol hydroxylase-like FAD-dependent oxidoreductase